MIEGLQACLQEIESGTKPEAALAKFPALSADLKPLIESALQAKSHGEAAWVSAELQKNSLNRTLAHARELRSTAAIPAPRLRRSLPRWAYAIGVVLILLMIMSSSALAVSEDALPGDVLYPVKLAAENTRLALTQDDAARLELQHQFDDERNKEVQNLIQDARLANVRLVGVLEETSADVWKVSGIPVDVSQAGQLPQGAQVGYEVIVAGQLLQDGSIRASSVSLHIFRFSGRLTQMTADHWTVGKISVSVDSLTRITGDPQLGQTIQVEAVMTGGGRLTALALAASGEVVEDPETETPVFTQTSDDPGGADDGEPQPTGEQGATEAPDPTEEQHPIETPQPSETVEPGHTPEPTQTEELSQTPEHTDDPEQPTTQTPDPTEEHDD